MNVQVYDFNQKTGSTHKKAGIKEYIHYALEKGANTISVISSGNLLSELKSEISKNFKGLGLVNLVNESYRKPEGTVPMENGRILRDSAEREDYIENYGNLTGTNYGKVVDVTDFIPNKYAEHAKSILNSNPTYVSVPIGSGKNFLSIYREIKRNGLETKLIGFMPKGQNGIFTDEQFEKDGNLYFKKFNPKTKADKLVTPYVLEEYRKEMLEAEKEGHVLYEMTESELNKSIKEAKKFNLNTEPSAATAFYANTKGFIKNQNMSEDSNLVIVNTGKGKKANNVVKIPIVLKKKMLSLVGAGLMAFSSIYLSNWYPTQDRINSKLDSEFFAEYYPNLLKDGKMPVLEMGPSSVDLIMDKRNAFVYGDTTHLVYLNKFQVKKLVKQGEIRRKEISKKLFL